MKRPVSLGIVVVLLIAAVIAAVAFLTNVGRSEGLAEFTLSSGGMNALAITGPAGWRCIEYSKEASAAGTLEVTDRSMSNCGFAGPLVLRSNRYPSQGKTVVPLNQPVRVYQDANKTYEVYVWLTQDATALDRLESDTPSAK